MCLCVYHIELYNLNLNLYAQQSASAHHVHLSVVSSTSMLDLSISNGTCDDEDDPDFTSK